MINITYTYECLEPKCKKQFEIERGINEEIKINCPECNGKEVKRIFVPLGTVVKCDGFFGKSK